MRVQPSRDRYLKLSMAKKQKQAVEWCMQILRADIDNMPLRDLRRLFYDYYYLIAYPEPFGSVLFPTDTSGDEDEKTVRQTFKEYKKVAEKIMSDFRAARSDLKFHATMAFRIKVGRNGEYKTSDETDHDFEYSYATQIARLLNGRKFDDIIKQCPACHNAFAVVSGHKKESCGHKCSMALSKKKRIASNPALVRRQGNINAFVSRCRKRGETDERIRSTLSKYVRENNYTSAEIPSYIKEIIKWV
jgi:hypothetical protein